MVPPYPLTRGKTCTMRSVGVRGLPTQACLGLGLPSTRPLRGLVLPMGFGNSHHLRVPLTSSSATPHPHLSHTPQPCSLFPNTAASATTPKSPGVTQPIWNPSMSTCPWVGVGPPLPPPLVLPPLLPTPEVALTLVPLPHDSPTSSAHLGGHGPLDPGGLRIPSSSTGHPPSPMGKEGRVLMESNMAMWGMDTERGLAPHLPTCPQAGPSMLRAKLTATAESPNQSFVKWPLELVNGNPGAPAGCAC